VKETQVQNEFGEGGTLEEETGKLKVWPKLVYWNDLKCVVVVVVVVIVVVRRRRRRPYLLSSHVSTLVTSSQRIPT
jgi:hypothetical protein